MQERARSLAVAAWATLVSQVAIVGTGGAVRLTGSGLGCDSWPNCTPDAFVPTPEMGIHSAIEFANRAWGGIVVLIAAIMLVLAIRRRAGRGIVTLSALVLGLTVAQALIGAVVVWMHLRPDTVGIHFFLSVALVALSAVLVWRVVVGPAGPRVASAAQAALVHALTAVVGAVVVLGVLIPWLILAGVVTLIIVVLVRVRRRRRGRRAPDPSVPSTGGRPGGNLDEHPQTHPL